MGDVAMVVPVLRALTEQHKKVKVTVISRAFFKPFFNGIPNIDFFAAEPNGKHKGFLGLLKLYSELKKLHVYGVADLHNVLRSRIITTLFRLKGKKTATVDKARSQRAALTRPDNKVFEPLVPITERYADVFEMLGYPIDLKKVKFIEKQSLTDDIIATTGTRTENWVGIAPFAKHRAKIYPKDLMQEVINQLLVKPKIKIFLFGAGRSEIKKLEGFAEGHDNVIVIAGKMSFKQELQLISNLDIMLSMDSGNAHIAAMYGVNVITLWGATHPYAGFAPFNQPEKNQLVADREQYPKLPTSIYGNKKVEGYENAMRTIKPNDVVTIVDSYLNHNNL
ncbi:lipopolysaccharide heptosyltransferase family protein [Flavobacterium arcticum]|uniref:Lipopolysaccharide heptosyltransferase family protein n=2 Tax=Flavobacterium arcticum TaxID=1784713 RepID=A0A345HF72_9FLAO|nr:lipopolysaccharide heptosyltransferase family protein [Flavobacterium arcticum]KAF2511835.1 glycosyltransferase family 9 protein [Flavobacterium arcticum]